MLKTMSPGTRIQTNMSISGYCMNSADLAYQLPWSMAASNCSVPDERLTWNGTGRSHCATGMMADRSDRDDP